MGPLSKSWPLKPGHREASLAATAKTGVADKGVSALPGSPCKLGRGKGGRKACLRLPLCPESLSMGLWKCAPQAKAPANRSSSDSWGVLQPAPAPPPERGGLPGRGCSSPTAPRAAGSSGQAGKGQPPGGRGKGPGSRVKRRPPPGAPPPGTR